jgi:hypothetical protein
MIGKRLTAFLLIAAMPQLVFGAFPSVASITETTNTTPTANHIVNLPATVDAGDLLLIGICVAGTGGFGTLDTPAGWTELWEGSGAGNVTYSVFARDAVGDEDGGTVTVTQSGGTLNDASQTYRITAASWGGTLGTDIDTGVDLEEQTTIDPPSVTAGGGSADNLFIVFAGVGNDGETVTGYSTNYTNGTDTVVGAGSNLDCTIASQRREFASASDDPDTITFSSAFVGGVNTMVVAPAASSTIAPLVAAYYEGMQ